MGEKRQTSQEWQEQIPSTENYGKAGSYYYYLESAVQGWEIVRTLSVQRPQPHTTNPSKEEEDKIVGDKKERVDHANRKAMALLLKPASLTPSNMGSLRSFQRDTERGTKVLRY